MTLMSHPPPAVTQTSALKARREVLQQRRDMAHPHAAYAVAMVHLVEAGKFDTGQVICFLDTLDDAQTRLVRALMLPLQ
jgi:hypothetical protein